MPLNKGKGVYRELRQLVHAAHETVPGASILDR